MNITYSWLIDELKHFGFVSEVVYRESIKKDILFIKMYVNKDNSFKEFILIDISLDNITLYKALNLIEKNRIKYAKKQDWYRYQKLVKYNITEYFLNAYKRVLEMLENDKTTQLSIDSCLSSDFERIDSQNWLDMLYWVERIIQEPYLDCEVFSINEKIELIKKCIDYLNENDIFYEGYVCSKDGVHYNLPNYCNKNNLIK